MAYDAEVRVGTKIDTSQMQKLEIQINKSTDKVAQLVQKMNELKNQKIPTDDYVEVQKQIDVTKAKLNKLLEKKEDFRGSRKSSTWLNLNNEIEKLQVSLPYLKSELQDLVDTGAAFTLGQDSAEYANLARNLTYENANLQALYKRQEELIEKQDKGFVKIVASAKKAFTAMNGGAKKTNGLLSTMGTRLKGLALSLLIFNQISKAFNAMVQSAKEGFNNLVKYSDSYNQSMSELKSANTQLKNSFATAFAPIVQIAIPHLITLINYVTSAMNIVSQFMAVLSGKSTWTKAKQVQEDYAESLNGTASAAKNAAGALAAFDKLNVINQNTGSSSGVRPEDMFEEVPIESEVAANLAKQLKDLIEAEDWYGVGELIGEKISEALEAIDWEEAYQGAREFGTGFATFLNGLISPRLFGNVGKTVAGALNTAIYASLAFGQEFDFYEFGESIASGINEFFRTYDFEASAETLNTWIDGLEKMIAGFLKTISWTDILSAAGDFLGNLELDTVSIIIGSFAWTHGGEVLTVGLFKELLGKAIGLETVKGGFAIVLTVGIVLDVAFKTSNTEGAEEYLESLKKFDTLDFNTMKLKDWVNVLEEFALATIGLSGTHDAEFTKISELLEAMPQKEDYGNLRTYNEELKAWKEQVQEVSNSRFKIPGIEYDENGWNQAINELRNKTNEMLLGDDAKFFNAPLWEWDVEGYWQQTLKPSIDNLALELQEWWKTNVVPWFSKEKWSGLYDNIKTALSQKWLEIEKWWSESAVGKWFKENVEPWFSKETWSFKGIEEGLSDVFDSAVEAIKRIWNNFAEWLNKKLTFNIDTSSIIGKGISEVLGGSTISLGKIPMLADGAVIRGGNPFVAILGDQPRGQTNIEAPLSTIKQAVRETLRENGSFGGGEYTFIAQLNGKTIYKETVRQDQMIKKATGRSKLGN